MRLASLLATSVASVTITLATFTSAATPGERQPGKGSWIVGELGASLWQANYYGATADRLGRGGLAGPGARVRAGVLLGVAPGFAVGPMAGFESAFTHGSSDPCCDRVNRVDTLRVGVEGAYWPNPRVGLRLLFGFGVTTASTSIDGQALVGPGGASGSYLGLGLARDWAVGPRLRLGGVLRLDAERLVYRDLDLPAHSLRVVIPSLSIVALMQ